MNSYKLYPKKIITPAIYVTLPHEEKATWRITSTDNTFKAQSTNVTNVIFHRTTHGSLRDMKSCTRLHHWAAQFAMLISVIQTNWNSTLHRTLRRKTNRTAALRANTVALRPQAFESTNGRLTEKTICTVVSSAAIRPRVT